jgi:uncharacterized protein YchJ
MNKLFLWFVLIIFLGGCAVSKTVNMSGDLGSPEKHGLLKKRADQFWSAFVSKDYDTVYNMFDPFFRATMNRETFKSHGFIVNYLEYEVSDVKVRGNIGSASVRIKYSLQGNLARFNVKKDSIVETEFSEKWLYVYDTWYKEYYIESADLKYADY